MRKPRAVTEKGPAFHPSGSSPSKFQKDSSSPKIAIYWQTYIHSEKEHFFGDYCSKDSYLKKKKTISEPSETSRQLRQVSRVAMRVVNVFRYLILWFVCMAWYGKNNTLSSSWNASIYSPGNLTYLTLCPKLTVVPHFSNTKLLEFFWIYTYDLWTSTQEHLLCLGNLHSEIMETMRIYGVSLRKSWEICFSFHV